MDTKTAKKIIDIISNNNKHMIFYTVGSIARDQKTHTDIDLLVITKKFTFLPSKDYKLVPIKDGSKMKRYTAYIPGSKINVDFIRTTKNNQNNEHFSQSNNRDNFFIHG